MRNKSFQMYLQSKAPGTVRLVILEFFPCVVLALAVDAAYVFLVSLVDMLVQRVFRFKFLFAKTAVIFLLGNSWGLTNFFLGHWYLVGNSSFYLTQSKNNIYFIYTNGVRNPQH